MNSEGDMRDIVRDKENTGIDRVWVVESKRRLSRQRQGRSLRLVLAGDASSIRAGWEDRKEMEMTRRERTSQSSMLGWEAGRLSHTASHSDSLESRTIVTHHYKVFPFVFSFTTSLEGKHRLAYPTFVGWGRRHRRGERERSEMKGGGKRDRAQILTSWDGRTHPAAPNGGNIGFQGPPLRRGSTGSTLEAGYLVGAGARRAFARLQCTAWGL
ncbi:hypothetical protein FB45DRAFT_1010756 [Roridomyces roridus]|uniref:Uncharacterized protein n=1 Tax=Roridomyces roridus TaxID=1738132 RepID=A0AAD7B2C0_9AGAR|nr:hypothetical protein FB45DRAFT_1010756 [Roridomyces roridus]